MITFPNAKINIGLFVTERRHDGFHNLETIFYPIKDCRDALEIIYNDKDELVIEGLSVHGDIENNLVWRSLCLIRADYPVARVPVKMVLLKQIPMGAGLGGGSADAAFALLLIRDFFNLDIPQRQLQDYALQLGSDVPFFLMNQPAYGKSRGEQLEPIALSLDDYEIRLVHHDIHISTAAAFRGIVPAPATIDLRNIDQIPITSWKDLLTNDFEKTIFPLYPELADSKASLYEQGAIYASMTGTGATVYGIFNK